MSSQSYTATQIPEDDLTPLSIDDMVHTFGAVIESKEEEISIMLDTYGEDISSVEALLLQGEMAELSSTINTATNMVKKQGDNQLAIARNLT